jgi:hypothetical protein
MVFICMQVQHFKIAVDGINVIALSHAITIGRS